jgi:hypothetical protein
VLKVKNWKELTRNRKEWSKLVEKAKNIFLKSRVRFIWLKTVQFRGLVVKV